MKKALNFLTMRLLQNQKKIHHFRSWNLHSEMIYLQTCWENCLKVPSCIPAKIIEANGNVHRINNISFLMDTKEENSTSNQLIETSNQYFPQKSLIMQEGINMQPGVSLQIQKNIFQKETKKKKTMPPYNRNRRFRKGRFSCGKYHA